MRAPSPSRRNLSVVGACVGQRCVVCRAEKTNRREKLVWATVTPFGGIRTEELTVYPGTRIESRPPEIFVGGYNHYSYIS